MNIHKTILFLVRLSRVINVKINLNQISIFGLWMLIINNIMDYGGRKKIPLVKKCITGYNVIVILCSRAGVQMLGFILLN